MKEIWRLPFRYSFSSKLKKRGVRIIASNCIGGILYHDLRHEFLSPTINLYIENFIDFVENLDSNLKLELEDAGYSKSGYPLAKIGSSIIHGVHYHSFESLRDKWVQRTRKFFASTGEIIVICTDSQLAAEDYEKFKKLPYKKVCFCNKKTPNDDFVYIPGFENRESVGDVLRYTDLFGTRLFQKYFDIVSFINKDLHGNA